MATYAITFRNALGSWTKSYPTLEAAEHSYWVHGTYKTLKMTRHWVVGG